MHKDHSIKIDGLTRVEGHGNIVVNIKKGRVEDLRFEITESPRFFEVMLKGRHYSEAHHIMSRICGICAVSHTSASVKAVEDAMGIKISRQTRLLRELALCGEMIQSHILHLYFMVLPDLLGHGSLLPLLQTDPEMAKVGLHIKKTAGEVCRVVGGRLVHPIAIVPGAVAHLPMVKELKALKKDLKAGLPYLDRALELFHGFQVPAFSVPLTGKKEFISLSAPRGYPTYGGEPYSNLKGPLTIKRYSRKIIESTIAHSTAKHARTKRGSFMVGALARMNNNYRRLHPAARAAAKKAGLAMPCYNPFQNNMAQLIECFHLSYTAIELIDKLTERGLRKEKPGRPTRYGRGTGIVEAPRGILYHRYTISRAGKITSANCMIPTAKNLSRIEEDLRAYVPTIMETKKENIRARIEQMVRAFDPCISCSSHIMKVTFK
ncbi:Sulfhydrogenase subunit alpha [hydrothermal vent metagenome]|uniref:Sulfhydrogenase subunit alpha n=1 Tax=hydrothermal vent metagenome TaxID=652676 RepID=A0A3B0V3X4_9ZZZZ